MLSDLNLKIDNLGPINNADIKIGKINVIGGLNATGKSTASKLLYCFLKGGTINRQEFAYSLIEPKLSRIVRMANRRVELEKFLMDDDYEDFDMHQGSLLDQYKMIRNDIVHNNESSFSDSSFYSRIQDIDKQIEVIEENGDKLYISLLQKLLFSEFDYRNLKGSVNFEGKFNNNYFKYSANLISHQSNFSCSDFFLINDVIYVDSLSIFDFRKRRLNNHVSHLMDYIFISEDDSLEFFNPESYKKIIIVEDKIKDLLKGKFVIGKFGELKFISDDGYESQIIDISSGMKQIMVIQRLLSNQKLKENSFLIIDEPEVNLHPEWQIKLAEIFVLLAHELNIHIYINSHSPMFIEAMSIFSEYYNLQDETYFYLTEKIDNNGYYFKEIAFDNMGAVYENLAKPYNKLDYFKSKIAHNDLGD